MNCPKYVAAAISYQGSTADINVDCDKEECAWWCGDSKQCDPTGLLPWVQSLAEAIDDIREKMPYKAAS